MNISKIKHHAYLILLNLTTWLSNLFFTVWIVGFIDVIFFKNSEATFSLIGSIQTTQTIAALKYFVLTIITYFTIKDLKAVAKKLR